MDPITDLLGLPFLNVSSTENVMTVRVAIYVPVGSTVSGFTAGEWNNSGCGDCQLLGIDIDVTPPSTISDYEWYEASNTYTITDSSQQGAEVTVSYRTTTGPIKKKGKGKNVSI